MASKKLVENIERGLMADVTDSSGKRRGALAEHRGRYTLFIYRMPGMESEGLTAYDDLNALEKAMREFQPDMRRWRISEPR